MISTGFAANLSSGIAGDKEETNVVSFIPIIATTMNKTKLIANKIIP